MAERLFGAKLMVLFQEGFDLLVGNSDGSAESVGLEFTTGDQLVDQAFRDGPLFSELLHGEHG